ncbi:MAG TPA: alpha-1 4-glucan-protein synthase [archaeon]|nr:alpha-1 4-glucan-protein synthase [archaeon]
MKDICIIIPTIRNYGIVRNYLRNARESGFDVSRLGFLLVTEDFCDISAMKKMLFEEGVQGEVVGQSLRDAWFEKNGIGDFKGIIPRKSHAETSFGLLWMLTGGYDYGIFIDDDTAPLRGTDYFGSHMANLGFRGKMPSLSSDKNWVNVLHHNFTRHMLYPRGYPYSCINETIGVSEKSVKNAVISQGLWTEIPDLDSIRILSGGDLNGQSVVKTVPADFRGNFVVNRSNYLTVCSMNLAFKREIIPAFYQLPMDDNPWKIGRFDDIWSGVFAKKACDIMDDDIITGMPLCAHNKAPRSTFKDLNAEVPALEINEHLWKITDSVRCDSKSYVDIYRAIAERMITEKGSFINADYLQYLGKKMLLWLDCVTKLS